MSCSGICADFFKTQTLRADEDRVGWMDMDIISVLPRRAGAALRLRHLCFTALRRKPRSVLQIAPFAPTAPSTTAAHVEGWATVADGRRVHLAAAYASQTCMALPLHRGAHPDGEALQDAQWEVPVDQITSNLDALKPLRQVWIGVHDGGWLDRMEKFFYALAH
jgi:hypothetical protein